eukprot:scaffold1730_cov35-Tisochrysis_lutea.AAC.7
MLAFPAGSLSVAWRERSRQLSLRIGQPCVLVFGCWVKCLQPHAKHGNTVTVLAWRPETENS